MLGAVVLGVEQEHRQQLRRSDPCSHQPVGHVVSNGRHQPAQVSHYQLSAAKPWTLHWRRKRRTFNLHTLPLLRYQISQLLKLTNYFAEVADFQ